MLAPLREGELLFRILQGPCGATLGAATYEYGSAQRARPVVEWIRQHLDQPLNVAALAREANVSPATLYRHFKAATTMTPLQFQKQLRLDEARRLLLGGEGTALSAAQTVGYRSATQFSREYRRRFGEPPSHRPERV